MHQLQPYETMKHYNSVYWKIVSKSENEEWGNKQRSLFTDPFMPAFMWEFLCQPHVHGGGQFQGTAEYVALLAYAPLPVGLCHSIS